MPKEIQYEQAVYGSFPFWDRGYAVLARSAGCRGEWTNALRLAGQRFGERPTGVAEHSSLFALPLHRGPRMIVGVFPSGCDDQGRPGALVFHGLFVSPWAYFWAGTDPFVFTPALRHDWSQRDQDVGLPAGRVTMSSRGRARAEAIGSGRQMEAIVAALMHKRRVVIPSAAPIDNLARAVWRALPRSVRRRASVATWAFCNDNRFDLVAVPSLAGLTTDPAELIVQPDFIDESNRQEGP
jgi:hypothetical protein